MSNKEKVSEVDLRDPKFRNVRDPENELEFRNDGTIVFKARWENCVRSLFNILELKPEDTECHNVIKQVEILKRNADSYKNGYTITFTIEDDTTHHYYDNTAELKNIKPLDYKSATVFITLHEAQCELEYLEEEGSSIKHNKYKFFIEYIQWEVKPVIKRVN